MRINNEVYDAMAEHWWAEDGCGTMRTILYFVNNVRFAYFLSILKNEAHFEYSGECLIDIGCGGGYLSEEFAKLGMKVTGVDPSKESLKVAEKHADDNKLNIEYVHGYGENLPFASQSFPFAVCCDVFEHVNDVNAVVCEISRILTPGGIVFFDTINRTIISKISLKISQDFASTSFIEPNVHVWEKFIKPNELAKIFEANCLKTIEIKGMSPRVNMFSAYRNLRRYKKKEISVKELAGVLDVQISNNIQNAYIGYAVKL